jgi:hypothetical protein
MPASPSDKDRMRAKTLEWWMAKDCLKPTIVFIILKNSVRTSKRTPHFTITKINWLKLFKEIITLCSEKHEKLINTKYKATDY